jgi:hypothetical protein
MTASRRVPSRASEYETGTTSVEQRKVPQLCHTSALGTGVVPLPASGRLEPTAKLDEVVEVDLVVVPNETETLQAVRSERQAVRRAAAIR